MQTTGIFTVSNYTIPYPRFGETFYLIPFGDIHRSSPACDVERFMDFLSWAKTKKNAYFLGMGDYDDLASASERNILTDRKLHDSTQQTLDSLYRKHTQRFAKEIGFMKGRIIGLIEGNHFGQLMNATTTTQYLCELLECKYLGVSSFINLRFEPKGFKHATNLAIDIWAHHGKAGGRLPGATINSVGRMMDVAEADIFLCGHDHQKGVVNVSKLRLEHGGGGYRLAQRKVLLGRTGSFLRGYEDGKASYVADAAMRPSDLGVIKIEMTPKRERKTVDGKISDLMRVDIHASI